jgi:Family of unknown function (DUF6152)
LSLSFEKKAIRFNCNELRDYSREAQMARKTLGILMVLVGFASMTALLSAHHSRAMYDVEQLVSVEGVVTNVEWRNPHMWITLDVPGPTGKPESWGFEGSGAASMVASGISPQILKVGNKVKIIAHPPRDKSKRTAEFMGMEVNGRYYSRGTGSNIRGSGEN